MLLEPDLETEIWLQAAPDLQWDTGNESKSKTKHGVSLDEVESIFDAPIVFAGRIVEPAQAEPRWLLFGVTENVKPIALVFTRRGEYLRPISARPMRRKERKMYAEKTGS